LAQHLLFLLKAFIKNNLSLKGARYEKNNNYYDDVFCLKFKSFFRGTFKMRIKKSSKYPDPDNWWDNSWKRSF